jgi:hypothetical protein
LIIPLPSVSFIKEQFAINNFISFSYPSTKYQIQLIESQQQYSVCEADDDDIIDESDVELVEDDDDGEEENEEHEEEANDDDSLNKIQEDYKDDDSDAHKRKKSRK